MKLMLSAAAFALAMSATAAVATPQTIDPQVSVPSAQNSAAGIPGLPGDKDGPAVRPGVTVASAAATKPMNLAVREQDAAKIRGLPGSESGPAMPAPRGGM
jgi:hypothetical protein